MQCSDLKIGHWENSYFCYFLRVFDPRTCERYHVGINIILRTHRIYTRERFFCNIWYHTGWKPVSNVNMLSFLNLSCIPRDRQSADLQMLGHPISVSTQSQICCSDICQSVDRWSPKISKMSDWQIDRSTDWQIADLLTNQQISQSATDSQKGQICRSANLSILELENLTQLTDWQQTDWQICLWWTRCCDICWFVDRSAICQSVDLSICQSLIFEIFGDRRSTDWQIADQQIWLCVGTVLYVWPQFTTQFLKIKNFVKIQVSLL